MADETVLIALVPCCILFAVPASVASALMFVLPLRTLKPDIVADDCALIWLSPSAMRKPKLVVPDAALIATLPFSTAKAEIDDPDAALIVVAPRLIFCPVTLIPATDAVVLSP